MSEEWCVVCDCVTVECAVERSEVDVRTGGGWEEDGRRMGAHMNTKKMRIFLRTPSPGCCHHR